MDLLGSSLIGYGKEAMNQQKIVVIIDWHTNSTSKQYMMLQWRYPQLYFHVLAILNK